MARQNKRNKNSNVDGKHRNGDSDAEVAEPGKRALYVQLLLNDPALVHHADQLKEAWTQATNWEVNDDVGQTSLVLLSVNVQSHVQLQVVKDILSTCIVDPVALSASCRLQVENNSQGTKCLRLTLQLSDSLQAYLAKTSNSLQLKLASHGISATNRFEPKALKKLRSVVLWSLDETLPSPSLHDEIAETNRQGWTAPLELRSLVLAWTHTPASIISAWRVGSSQPPASPTINLHGRVPIDARTVVIMRGRPGSGKSTLSQTIQSMARDLGHDVAVCSADTHFDSPLGYFHDKSQLTAAHDGCKRAFKDAIELNTPVIIVDNTNSCLWEYEPYRTAAIDAEYRVVVVEVGCDDVATAVRMGFRNSHGVGIDVMLRMHQRWEPHACVHPFEVHVLLQPAFTWADNRRAVALLLQGDIGSVYIAAVYFSDETRQMLLDRFPPKHANVIAEHMTLAFQPSRAFVEAVALGQLVHLKVVEERFDEKGHCLKLQWLDNAVAVDSAGQRILHTTISFAPDSAAYYSNVLLLDDAATVVSLEPHEQVEIPGQVGVALQSKYVPKWKRAQLLDLPRSTWAPGLGPRHVTVLHAPAAIDDKAAVVAELERVAGPGTVLILVTSDEQELGSFAQRQIEFHHVIVSATATIAASVDQVKTFVPDVEAVTVLTTSPASLPTVDALQSSIRAPVAIHVLDNATLNDQLPPSNSSPFVLRQLVSDIQQHVTSLWRTIAGDSFVDAVAHAHLCNDFDINLSSTGAVSLHVLRTRLIESLPPSMQTRQRQVVPSDEFSFVDVHVSACYAVTFRLVLFVHPSPSPVVRSLVATQRLLHRRPIAIESVQERFTNVLRDVSLPFPDIDRSTRVLAVCLARGYVRLHPHPNENEFDQHMLAWDETDWLVCLADKDVDAIALCHALHLAVDDDPSAATPAQLRDLELQVVRGILLKTKGTADDGLYQWLAFAQEGQVIQSPSWQRSLDQLCLRQRLRKAFPRQVAFRRDQIGLDPSALAAAQSKRGGSHRLANVRLTDVRTGQHVQVFV